MLSKDDFQKAVELIAQSNDILLTTHTRPDGDACGSVTALFEVLTSRGKKVSTVFLSQVPQWYEFLFTEKPSLLDKDISAKPDLLIIIDTNSLSQLPGFDEYLKHNTAPVLVIDHHVTADGLGDVELVDTTAAATAMIIFALLKYASWRITEKIAEALFTGIATDTGWFQFDNTDAGTYRVCADLADSGVNPAALYRRLYQNFSPQRFALMTAMLGTLELHFACRYASLRLLRCDFERTGAAYEDTENLIDECRRLGTVEAAALFVELKDSRIRCSLRSRGLVDVSRIAKKFGGGGHKMAAGTYLPGPLKSAEQLIKAELEKLLR
jgi:phosphoesterase RecJ-like protein